MRTARTTHARNGGSASGRRVSLRSIIADLSGIVHGGADTLIGDRLWLGALNDIRLGLAGEWGWPINRDARRVEEAGHEWATEGYAQVVAAICS